MQSFLKDIAQHVYKHFPSAEKVCLVFPSRRAALYFKKEFSGIIDKPVLSPVILSIEDLYHQLSKLKRSDELNLVYKLHQVYKDVYQNKEPFEQFYFWGKMLLRDFDEIDKYLVNAEHIFKNLSDQKELDSVFDFLTEEQLGFLKAFWGDVNTQYSRHQKGFVQFWEKLWHLYRDYKETLIKDGDAYEGMLQREVVERMDEAIKTLNDEKIIFAGFNALTKTDEALITKLIAEKGAEIFWDIDGYYLNDTGQEAGYFFRNYQEHQIFKNTFPAQVPWNFKAEGKQLHIYGTAQQSAQIKLLCQQLAEQLDNGMKEEDTVVILPNESLMLPVLQSLSPVVKHINVTMGYPLIASAAYQLLEQLIDLQISFKQEHFDHRKVQTVLTHPYIQAIEKSKASAWVQQINKENRTSIAPGFFTDSELLVQLFNPSGLKEILIYLRNALDFIARQKPIHDFDKEYIFHLYKQLNRIQDVLGEEVHDLRSFQRLFRQLCRTQRIPFVAEPLRGVQVMGVLETRNIDFNNVFILSMNEGNWPSNSTGSSYIPYNIRKAYELPSIEHGDAIQAYHFYRVLQRAENIHLFYNTEADAVGGGEKSRYLQQLIFESALPFQEHVLSAHVNPSQAQEITIEKDAQVLKKLEAYFSGHPSERSFYPTNLTDYLECSLRFYLKHIEQIKEADEVEDDLDARILGDILHKTLEFFYRDLKQVAVKGLIQGDDIQRQEKQIDKYIDEAFQDKYKHLKHKVIVYEGQQLIVKEIVKRFAGQVLKLDKAYAPFNIVGLEEKNYAMEVPLQGRKEKVRIKGIIDRVDLKGDVLRIVDYKTGKDEAIHNGDLADLFSKEAKVNKAAFQVLMYAMLYAAQNKHDYKILPGLLGRKDLFNPDFQFGLKINGQIVEDVRELLPEFKTHFTELLQEIYHPEIPFQQTQNIKNCSYCSFKEICYR